MSMTMFRVLFHPITHYIVLIVLALSAIGAVWGTIETIRELMVED